MEGDQKNSAQRAPVPTISIHALRVEGDSPRSIQAYEQKAFLSTPSGWRATRRDHHQRCQQPPRNFYPRPPGGGRQSSSNNGYEGDLISIHALRVEGDSRLACFRRAVCHISIHALRVEGDSASARKAATAWNFYPRPPGGGRHAKAAARRRTAAISIHALRVEGDIGAGLAEKKESGEFLSTPSGWRATACYLGSDRRTARISIHALRVEGDPPGAAGGSASKRGFLSTPSGWRATRTVA